MPSLDRLISSSRRAVEQRRERRPLSELEQAAAELDPIRPFTEAVVGEEMAFVLRCIDSPELLEEAVAAGVAGLTVTDDDGLERMAAATTLPLLHRGIVIDPYQLYEVRVEGADGVVLIAAAFEDEDDRFSDMYATAADLGLDVIVEVADEQEIERALELLDPDSFLIRNRERDDKQADFERTFSLLEEVPAGKAVLSQGGIRTREQAAALEGVGVDAAILGRWIYRQPLTATLDMLRGDMR